MTHKKTQTETFYLVNDDIKQNVIDFVQAVDTLSKLKVVISPVKNKTVSQRGLQWQWYKDLSKSGIGESDDEIDIHLRSKYRWALPIYLRDDEVFAEIWPVLKEKYYDDEETMRYMVDHFISTEKEGFAMSEYLNNFHRYWTEKGVELTDPATRGLDDLIKRVG